MRGGGKQPLATSGKYLRLCDVNSRRHFFLADNHAGACSEYIQPLTFEPRYYIIDSGHEREVDNLAEKKKIGRPTNNPKGASVHVRLDRECDAILNTYCEERKVPKTEAIRRGIMKLKDDLAK